jgi:hypothetical protein
MFKANHYGENTFIKKARYSVKIGLTIRDYSLV